MKKKTVFLLLFVLAYSLHSYEWGGILRESFACSKETSSDSTLIFSQKNGLDFWLQSPIAHKDNLNFKIQTLFDLNFDFGGEVNSASSILDFDLIQFSFFKEFSSFSFFTNIGRIKYQDYTKKIISQKLDGIKGSILLPAFSVDCYFGFTGLLNSLNDRMLDLDGKIPNTEGMNYVFAKNYFPFSFLLKFPSESGKSCFVCEFTGVFDSQPENNRYYSTFAIEGSALKLFSYQLTTTFGLVDFRSISNLSVLKFDISLFELIKLNVEASYASGKQLYLSSFTGLTSFSAKDFLHKEIAEQISCAMGVELDISLVKADLNAKALFDYPENKLDFSGILIASNIDFEIFSDLNAGFSGYYFVNMSEYQNDLFSFSINCRLLF